MRTARIVLASYRGLPSSERDDLVLAAALERRGARVETRPWDSETDWSAFDLCLLRSTWDYTGRREAFLAWIDEVERRTLLHNPGRLVRENVDKRYLARLEAAGVPVVPTLWFPRDAETPDLAACLEERGWSRGFLKPALGASSELTVPFAPGDGSLRAAARLFRAAAARGAVLVQPYLETVETEGEISVILVEGRPTHAVRKVPRPGDWRVQDDFAAHDERHPLDDEIVALAARVLSAADAADALYARVDLLRHEASWRLNELELVEPSLFFRHAPEAAETLAEAVFARLGDPGAR
ncbi:MAG: hypothetical protein R3F20_17450 [Planctomycetota bacterium]